MKKRTKKRVDLSKIKFNTLDLLLVFIMALVFGVLFGEALFSGQGQILSVNANSSSELNEIKSVYNTILNEYIEKVDAKKLKDAAIKGMISTLDDKHSIYFNEEESQTFQDELNGYFYGLGVAVTQKKGDLVTISEVYEDSPAEKAGLKKGDQYLKINGTDVSKATADEVSDKIKGTNGKEFTIVVRRNNEEKEVKATTGKVAIPSVTKKIIENEENKIAYLKISIFANNTDEQLKEKLNELGKDNITDLIIDLRYNQGGELDTAINIASEFLPKKTPIIQIINKKETNIKYSKGNNNPKYNIIVLINEGSASASEVLAAALNEQLNAMLIGENTYGKGTVQKTKQLSDGTIIKYTTETWKTSKGNDIEKTGVEPTIKIEQKDEYYVTGSQKDDAQLQMAIKQILK